MAKIPILLLSFLPLSFLFRAAQCAFPARCGTTRAFAAQRCTARAPFLHGAALHARHRIPCAARGTRRAGREERRHAFLTVPAPLRGAKSRRAGNAQGSTGNARARRRSFLHPDDSASTLRRLSYRRHTQRRYATRLSSCSDAIDACRTPTSRPAQVSIASSCPAHPLPAASAARLAPPAPQAGGPLSSACASRHLRLAP